MQRPLTGELKLDPSINVRTLPELFELARILAAQAVELYRALGERMAAFGNEGARAAFAAIEGEQRRHAAALEVRIPPKLAGTSDAARRRAEVRVFDDEELSGTRLVTPYRAVSVAVRNEERAFAFWTYISAHAATPEIKAEAERLALAQLERIRLLRVARRTAYRAVRRDDGRSAARLRVMPFQEFLAVAAHEEAALARLHDRISDELARVGDARAGPLKNVAADEAVIAESLRSRGAAAIETSEPMPRDSESLFNLALHAIEATAEFYLNVAEVSASEEVAAEAQRLSWKAVRRLASLNR